MRDLETATRAGRFKVADARVTFKMASYAIIGTALAVTQKIMPESVIDNAVVGLLCMTGIGEAEAIALAQRPCPPLPPESSVPEHRLR
jgi:hypothetical protein